MFTSVQYDSRAGDIALGIPFNIAGYFLLTQLIADQTGFKPGTFSHTIVFVIDSVIVQLLQGLAESEEYIFQIEDQEGNLISARKSVTDSSEIKSLYKNHNSREKYIFLYICRSLYDVPDATD